MKDLLENLDLTVNPATDFYKFATGKWLANHPQDPTYPSWSVFSMLKSQQWEQTKDIVLNSTSKHGKIMRQYYDMLMNWDQREAVGTKPVIDEITRKVDPIRSREEFISFMIKNRMGFFFCAHLSIDQKDSNRYIISLSECGLRLPSKEHYFSDDPEIARVREVYRQCTVKKLVMCGYSEEVAKQMEALDFNTQKQLAEKFYSPEDEFDPAKTYNLRTVAEFSKECDFDWKRYLVGMGYDKTDTFNVRTPEPIINNCHLLLSLPLETIKTIAICSIVDSATHLNRAWRDVEMEVEHAEYGDYEEKPDDKKAIYATKAQFAGYFEQEYINRCFGGKCKQEMTEMVENLRKAFAEIIGEQEWLSDATKQKTLDKLQHLAVETGYPDHQPPMLDAIIDPTLSLYENDDLMADRAYNFILKHYYNQPVDKGTWGMKAFSINAYFNASRNRLIFPAGILQPPFFTPGAYPAINYGAIGTIIGHEMTHGFDNHGKDYDADGNRTCWWSPEDEAEFNRLADITRQHFDELEVLPGLKCNGKLTLGENLADYGGLKIAYHALQKVMEGREDQTYHGYTWQQIFFISYAQNWACKENEEIIRSSNLTDEHPADHLRVNGTLPMFTPWYEAFGIKEDSPLFVSEDKRAKLW